MTAILSQPQSVNTQVLTFFLGFHSDFCQVSTGPGFVEWLHPELVLRWRLQMLDVGFQTSGVQYTLSVKKKQIILWKYLISKG